MQSVSVMRLFFTALILLAPFEAIAANSFVMNRHAPTCDKYWNESNKPKNMSEKEFEYRRQRICDQRWGLDGWPPVWLGSEPLHSNTLNSKCEHLKKRYYESMAGRHLLDNYECFPPEKAGGLVACKGFKSTPPVRAEESAQILERAVDENCYFY